MRLAGADEDRLAHAGPERSVLELDDELARDDDEAAPTACSSGTPIR
jgi:hypothetical protein